MEKDYKQIKILGKGATAEVFLVEEQTTGKHYAMKCCEREGILGQEAMILQSIQHPMFPYVKEYSCKNREYLVIEYIEGQNLQELLDKGISFSVEEVLYIMDNILSGLSYLHKQNPEILYRDLKPANIMLDKKGKVHLVDFGAACYGKDAKMTKAYMVGTYGYAAPEQFWQGAKQDKVCDIYAAGKVLAYLLSGKNPAEPPYDMEHFCKGLKHVSEPFLKIMERSLAMEPAARYEDCESMRRDIHRACEETKTLKRVKVRKKKSYTYKKCIWRSEYRRIF